MYSIAKTTSRPECVLTGVRDLEPLYSFKKFPVYVGCVESKDSTADIFCDMNWGISKSSGSLQLLDLLDPTLLYKQNHSSGTVGKTWQNHHKKFFDFICKHSFNNVLEIGGASGSLVNHFLNLDKDFEWTIIEPTDVQAVQHPKVNFISDFFETCNLNQKYDTIVHSHLFEHVYNPIKFLNKINDVLTKNGNHFITLPNMKFWLEQGFTNTLLFEHTFYVDDQILEYLLNKTGFTLIDKVIEEHSIFIYCKKTENTILKDIKFDYVKDLYTQYVTNLHNDLDRILEQLGNNEAFLFGGHVFSQTLLNIGLPESQVINILDNDPYKQGKRLYGTNLMVKSPLCLKELKDPIVIVRGGVYTKEIKESILNVNSTARII